MQRRYESLGLREALQDRNDYAKACKELAGLMKSVYSHVPKSLQNIIFQDVLEAFKSLPIMDTSQQLSSANLLMQSLEGVLPKHKKSIAISEYRQAAVAQRRHHKHQQEHNDALSFPLDVLGTIFHFLDIHSLGMASLVSRTWNSAAHDDMLWRSQFLLIFGNVYIPQPILQRAGFLIDDVHDIKGGKLKNVPFHHQGCWRKAFILSIEGNPFILKSSRVYCTTCNTIYWARRCPMQERRENFQSKCQHQHNARRVGSDEVARFIVTGCITEESSSNSDSDSDDERQSWGYRMWAYPKFYGDS